MNSNHWSYEFCGLLKSCMCQNTFIIEFPNIYVIPLLYVVLHYYFIVLILLTVVEQVEKSASVYSKSMQGHHICLLVKMVCHGS